MTKNKYFEGMERMFDNLERMSVMYWQYKRELETFDFVLDLAFESKHLSKNNYQQLKDFIQGELKKYV